MNFNWKRKILQQFLTSIPSVFSLPSIIGFIIFLVVLFVVYLGLLITSLFNGVKYDPTTSLTYFQGDSYYGMPYKKAFEDGNYTTIFNRVKSLNTSDKDIRNDIIQLNSEIKKILDKTKVKDLLPKHCFKYCDNNLSEVYEVKFFRNKDYRTETQYYKNIVNGQTGNKVYILGLSFKSKEDNKEYNMYYYDLLDGTLTKSAIVEPEMNNNMLFLKNKNIVNYYDKSWNKIKENQNISNYEYFNSYFLSHSNIIERFSNDTSGISDSLSKRYVIAETWNSVLSTNLNLKNHLKTILSNSLNYDNDKIDHSAIIDMLNFSGIKSEENKKKSLSNQFILSNEKINLNFLNNISFGKDYKSLKIKTKNFQDFDIEDAQKILNFKPDSIDEDSNEFGYEVSKDIVKDIKAGNVQTSVTWKTITKNNDTPIIKDGDLYYSPKYTYESVTSGKSKQSNCKIMYPAQKIGDYITYQKEALYTGQYVKVYCKHVTKKSVYYTYHKYQVPPLIEEAEVTFFKKFKFKDNEKNKNSYRELDDYNLNYFYDKSYLGIEESQFAHNIVSKMNNIYLDRESLLFKGIYITIKGFGIELKDNGKFITSKKSVNGYDLLLPEAPVKLELGILTGINEEIENAKKFDTKMRDKLASNDPFRILLLNKTKRLNSYLKNGFFLKYNLPIYKGSTIWEQKNDINIANFFIRKKEDLTDNQKRILEMYIDKDIAKLKNSYFYTMPQNKKFMSILDNLYNIKGDNISQSNIIKKYLIFFSDLTTNPKYKDLLTKKIDNFKYKNIFSFKNGASNYSSFEDGKRKGNKTIYTKSFDKCFSYTTLDSANDYILNNINENYNPLYNKVNNLLVKPCYQSYMPFVKINVKVNKERNFSDYKIKELQQKILDKLQYPTFYTYITDPLIYEFLIDDDYIVDIKNLEKNTQIYKIFENQINLTGIDSNGKEQGYFKTMVNYIKTQYKNHQNQNQIEANIQRILSNSNMFYLYDNNLEYLFGRYKETKDYKNSCNSNTEQLLENPKDPNFKCSLRNIYSEFLDKIISNKKYYFFIKEEYLKEKVEDEPFYSYYNYFYDNDVQKNLSFTGYDYELPKELPISKYIPLFKSRRYVDNISEIKTHPYIYDTAYAKERLNNTTITDFTYSFNLDNAFSYNNEHYIKKENLHKVFLNPNLYLHSYINGIKKKNPKYNINIFGTGFEGINSNKNKSDIDLSYLTDLTNYILKKVTNKKVIDDLNNIYKLDSLWYSSFDISPIISDSVNFFINSSVLNNIENYIKNGNFNKVLNNNVKNEDVKISNYDLLLKPYKVDYNNLSISNKEKKKLREKLLNKGTLNRKLFYNLVSGESIFKDAKDGRGILMNKYWYSVYILELLNKHYLEKGININTALSGNNNYESLINNFVSDDSDQVALLYKDTLLNALGFLDKEKFTTSWFGLGTEGNRDGYGVDTIHDLLLEKPTDLYKLSKYYIEYNNSENKNSKKYKGFQQAIDRLKDPNFIDNISGIYTKPIQNYKGNTILLTLDEIKKEKVLGLEMYYGDFYKVLSNIYNADKKNIAVNGQKISDIDGNNFILNEDIKTLINNQLGVIHQFKKNNPQYYYTYYLKPILSNIDLNEKELLELKDLYGDLVLKTYKIKTNLKEYNNYIRIIREGLPKKGVKIYSNIPYARFKHYYGYKPIGTDGINTDIQSIRTNFLNNNETSKLALYNMLNDLFVFNRQKSTEQTIITTLKEKLETKIKINRLKIQQNLKQIENIKENQKLLAPKIAKIKKSINQYNKDFIKKDGSDDYYMAVRMLPILKDSLEKIEKSKLKGNIENIKGENEKLKEINISIQEEINQLTEEDKKKLIKYKLVIENGAITIKNIEDETKKENPENKVTFFAGPFTENKNIGFVPTFYGSLTSQELTQNLVNSYIGYSFLINNLQVTEDGIKNIENELLSYSDNLNNTKVKKLNNIDNIGPFAPYYINNGYVSLDGGDTLKFKLVSIEEGVDNFSGIDGNYDSDFSVLSIKDRLTKEVLFKKFENLKGTYCKTLTTDSKQNTCVNYMTHLQELNPNELQGELDYITMLLYAKKSKAGKYVFKGYYPPENSPYRYTYRDLANEAKPNSVLKQYFQDWYTKNNKFLGQCTWYAAFLKSQENNKAGWSGNGRFVAYNIGKLGYSTDKYDPRREKADSILKKIQVGDVISFDGYNTKYNYKTKKSKCNYNGKYGHVAVVIGKDLYNKTITLGEMNMNGAYSVRKAEYKVETLCAGEVAHGLKRRF